MLLVLKLETRAMRFGCSVSTRCYFNVDINELPLSESGTINDKDISIVEVML